jgi:hypothetical protein
MINFVYLVILFLSVILPMLLLSSKLKRNLIAALKLTFSWILWILHLDLGASSLGFRGFVTWL